MNSVYRANLSVVGRSCPSSECSDGSSPGPAEYCGVQIPVPVSVIRRKTQPTGQQNQYDQSKLFRWLICSSWTLH